jgi:hypothetical protein
MALTIQKKDGPLFVADIAQLNRALEKRPKQKIILAGQLLICSLEEIRARDGMVIVPSRKVTNKFFAKKDEMTKLNLAVDKEAAIALNKARVRPTYAIDALLRYGQKMTKIDDVFVVSAVESSTSTMVSVLRFKKSVLTEYSENILSSPAAHTYEADLHVLLDRLRANSPSAILHWCSPLAQPRTHTFINGGSSIWGLASSQSLSISGVPSLAAQFGVPAFIAIGAALAYGGVLYPPYQNYLAAAKALEVENAALGEYTFASDRLKTLEARKQFFSHPMINRDKFAQFEEVLVACAQQEGLTVLSSRLVVSPGKDANIDEANDRTGYHPEFEVTVTVPKKESLLILEQSEPLLRALSVRLGVSLRLAVTGGFSESPSRGVNSPILRTYRIQGVLSHAT